MPKINPAAQHIIATKVAMELILKPSENAKSLVEKYISPHRDLEPQDVEDTVTLSLVLQEFGQTLIAEGKK